MRKVLFEDTGKDIIDGARLLRKAKAYIRLR